MRMKTRLLVIRKKNFIKIFSSFCLNRLELIQEDDRTSKFLPLE